MGQVQIIGALMTGGLGLLMNALAPRPKLKPVHVSSSTYGHMVPVTHGTVGVGGNYLWFTDLIPHEKTLGKGMGGGGTMVTYTVSFLVSFGEGIRNIRRIWCNGKLVYDARPGAKKKKKYKARISIYDGSEDQLPDPYYESHVGTGDVPAYRGQVTAFFQDFPLKDFGEALPQIMAEVVEEFAAAHHVILINDFTNRFQYHGFVTLDPRNDRSILIGPSAPTFAPGDYTTAGTITKIDGAGEVTIVEQAAINHGGTNGFDVDSDGFIYANSPGVDHGNIPLGKFDPATLTVLTTALNGAATTWFGVPGRIRVDRNSSQKFLWLFTDVDLDNGHLTAWNTDTMHLVYDIPRTTFGIGGGFGGSAKKMQDIDADASGNAWILLDGGGVTELWRVKPDGTTDKMGDLSSSFPYARFLRYVAADNTLVLGRVSGTPGLLKWDIDTLSTVKTLNVPPQDFSGFSSFHNPKSTTTIWLPDTYVDSGVSVPLGGQQIFPQFREIDLVKLTVKRTERFPEIAPQYPMATTGYGYFRPVNAMYDPELEAIFAEDFLARDIGKFSLRGAAACVSLESVIEAFSSKAGFDLENEIDASECASDLVCGYVIHERGPVRQMLEPLLTAHGVDAVETDGRVRFLPRNATPLLTIAQSDLAAYADNEQPSKWDVTETRQVERELPVSITVNCFDEYLDYEQSSEKAPRVARNVKTVAEVTVDFPEVFSPRRARQIAERMQYEAWMGRMSHEVSLPPRYMVLDPADVIEVDLDTGETYTFRLTNVDVGQNYVVPVKGVAVDAIVYDDPVQDNTTESPVSGGIPIDSPTILAVIDSPALQDADNGTIGPYLAVAPELGNDTAWSGAVVFRAPDNSAYVEVATMTGAATIGYTLDTLAAPSNWTTWDETSTLTVKLYAGEFTNFTKSDLLNGKGALVVGDEIVQYATASQVDDTTWTLSGPWTRGRRGTEWAIGSHTVGETVVALDPATLTRLSDPVSQANMLRYYRAVSIGSFLEDSTAQTETNTGRSLKPYSPTFVHGARDGSNNLTMTALRRSRYSAPFNPLISPVVGEESESYSLDVIVGGVVVRTINNTSLSFAYSAADQTSDGITPGDSVSGEVYQVSAAIGRGFGRPFTV